MKHDRWLYLSLDEVLLLHKKEIARFGGSSGVRDNGLLLSALGQAELFLFGELVYKNAYEIAAMYVYHIIKNHPFIDGNKRTGILAGLVFLRINNLDLITNNEELYAFAMDIAASRITKDSVIEFFKHRVCSN